MNRPNTINPTGRVRPYKINCDLTLAVGNAKLVKGELVAKRRPGEDDYQLDEEHPGRLKQAVEGLQIFEHLHIDTSRALHNSDPSDL